MTNIPTTSELIKKYGLNAKKSLGQNFILDKNFTDKIVKSVGDISQFNILEIGPGPGSLTRSILDAKPQKLIAVEKDQRCLEALKELQSFYPKLEIIEDDALKIDEIAIFKSEKFKIIANLPYNIGTPLIFKWIEISDHIDSMTLMLQKEVVQRITAKPNSKHYGRLAVMINFFCETKMVFEVKPSVFTPPPKVTSAIIEIKPRSKPLKDVDPKKLEKLVAIAFNQRRKMIKSTLKSIDKNIEKILEELEINPQARPENLTIEEFCKITKKTLATKKLQG